jgi:multidrug resistance efflux pump
MDQLIFPETVRSNPQLLSEEMYEIIHYKPHWFIRKGNIIFLLILCAMLLAASAIKYPDIINASVRLMSVNAPKMLESKTEGRLLKLVVQNGAYVKKDQHLAYLQSTADYEQVASLQEWINETEIKIEKQKPIETILKPMPQLPGLGELQTAYEDFKNTLKETQQLLANGYYHKKMIALHTDILYISLSKQHIEKQKTLLLKDYTLQKIEYDAKQKLSAEKIIAPLEFNQDKSRLLGKEQGLEQITSQLTESDAARHNKRKEIQELQKLMLDQEQKFYSGLSILKSHVEEWMHTYVVTAPENGKIEFLSFLQENQLLSAGQKLFFIQNPQMSYYAEMKVGQSGLGNIKNGQKVIIKLLSYPSTDFGYISGTVSYISSLPNERDSFTIKVDLPQGLNTNNGQQIFFRNNLSAIAEVVTDDKRLIARLFGRLWEIMER